MNQIPTAKLGPYLFALDTATVKSLQRNWQFNWSSQNRLGQMPAKQFTGIGDQTLVLSGDIYPGYIGDEMFIEQMADEAGKGHPLLLVTNIKHVGQVMGYWCITGCSETASNMDGGNKARTLPFSVNLSFYGKRYGNG